MSTRDEVKDLIRWAQELGWTYEGIGGNGHHILKLGGHIVPVANTPGEYRTLKNTEAKIRKFTGPNTPPRVQKVAGKFRKGGGGRSGFQFDAAVRDRDERSRKIEAVHADIEKLQGELSKLASHGRQFIKVAQARAAALVGAARQCKDLGCEVDHA